MTKKPFKLSQELTEVFFISRKKSTKFGCDLVASLDVEHGIPIWTRYNRKALPFISREAADLWADDFMQMFPSEEVLVHKVINTPLHKT